jgi:hypothetical protein
VDWRQAAVNSAEPVVALVCVIDFPQSASASVAAASAGLEVE